jgi:hypothetical protein
MPGRRNGLILGMLPSTHCYPAPPAVTRPSRWKGPATRLRAAAAQQLCSTSPREPPLATRTALVQCPATRGLVVGAVAGIPRWHARGQGFKSPQLHQAFRISRTRSERRLPEICQNLTHRVQQSALSADRFGRLRGLPRRAVVRTFYTEAQDQPAGGRLRRPSSAGRAAGTDLSASYLLRPLCVATVRSKVEATTTPDEAALSGRPRPAARPSMRPGRPRRGVDG